MKSCDSDEDLEEAIDAYDPHIVINDILDTEADYVARLKERGIFVVSFEDMGTGAPAADLVINALYEKQMPLDHYHWGQDYYCLREDFLLTKNKVVEEKVQSILLTFGGTDANDYTARVLRIIDALSLEVDVTVIAGLGYAHFDGLQALVESLQRKPRVLRDVKTISKHMREADVVFTSAGRTVYEVASIGTPVIVLAQNSRELLHTFARAENGIINLGLGHELDDDEIGQALTTLVESFELREKCSRLMLQNDLRSGMDNVLRLIFEGYDAFVARRGG